MGGVDVVTVGIMRMLQLVSLNTSDSFEVIARDTIE